MSQVELIGDTIFSAGVRQGIGMNDTPHFLTTRYQPIVDLASDVTIGFEVLSKIESEKFVDPETFFMRLESAAFIDIILQQIERINSFYDEQVPGCDLLFFINIRLSLLSSPELVYLICNSAKCQLALEIDFIDAMSFSDKAVMENIDILLDYGHEVWLDDYDGGELNQLVEEIPWSGIKIDKSFLWEYAMDCKKLGLILSSSLLVGRKTIIEGVETNQQKENCLRSGFMAGQGFYWREGTD
ncbi:EAL domain-containing protein [Aeromonas salmonicida]|uniref:EAL domain-containing protein n=1 Tax=Aeromonas salmonicida TaxID=645 RepID=UPI002796DBC0|nr:EAL domain-containing protein [Aeromonas salmonicida]MDQ1886078.1 EAL domain-containing protein [Aeromonas salmonicida]